METDFLRRSARCSRLEKNRNSVIRGKMNIRLYKLIKKVDIIRLDGA